MKMMQELYWDRGRILVAGFGIFFLKKPGLEFFFQKTGFGICAVRLCDKDKLKGNKTKTELPVIAAHPRAHSRVLKTFRDRSIYAISLLDTRISLKNICESW